MKFYACVTRGMQRTVEVSLCIWKWEDKGVSSIASSISFVKYGMKSLLRAKGKVLGCVREYRGEGRKFEEIASWRQDSELPKYILQYY